MPGLEKELAIFVHSVTAGMTVYGTYMLIRLIRRIVRHSILGISVEDFLFWVGTSFYLFMQIYNTSNGSVRWYFVLGVVWGMISLAFVLFLTKKMWKKVRKSIDKLGKTR